MNKHIHGGDIRGASKEYGLAKDEIIDFSANINFLGPPKSVIRVIRENLNGIINYPDPSCSSLKRELVNQLDVLEDNLLLGNGAVELIYLLAKVLKPVKALVLAPTFSEYRLAVESIGGVVEEIKLKQEEEFELDTTKLLPKLDEVDLFFLCNPNNPTGKFITRDEIVKIIDYASNKETFIIVDEAFVDLLEEEITVIDLVNKYDNLFVLRSLTKFFAIPGLRLGYGVGNQRLIKRLEDSKDPWNVNYFAQLAGEVAINDKDYIERTKIVIKQEKEFLYRILSQFSDLKVYYPSANYIFIDLSQSSLTASELEDKLARQGILIRNCNTYTGLDEDFIRIAVKSREDNLQLLDRLKEIFK